MVGGLPVRMFFLSNNSACWLRMHIALNLYIQLPLVIPALDQPAKRGFWGIHTCFHHKDPRFWKIHFHSNGLNGHGPGARVRRQWWRGAVCDRERTYVGKMMKLKVDVGWCRYGSKNWTTPNRWSLEASPFCHLVFGWPSMTIQLFWCGGFQGEATAISCHFNVQVSMAESVTWMAGPAVEPWPRWVHWEVSPISKLGHRQSRQRKPCSNSCARSWARPGICEKNWETLGHLFVFSALRLGDFTRHLLLIHIYIFILLFWRYSSLFRISPTNDCSFMGMTSQTRSGFGAKGGAHHEKIGDFKHCDWQSSVRVNMSKPCNLIAWKFVKYCLILIQTQWLVMSSHDLRRLHRHRLESCCDLVTAVSGPIDLGARLGPRASVKLTWNFNKAFVRVIFKLECYVLFVSTCIDS